MPNALLQIGRDSGKSGSSAVWLARLNGVQKAVGSSPTSPTRFDLAGFKEQERVILIKVESSF